MTVIHSIIFIEYSLLDCEIHCLTREIQAVIGIQVEEMILIQQNRFRLRCLYEKMGFQLIIDGSRGYELILLLIPEDPLKMKVDINGKEALDLAWYIRILMKIIAGYEIIEMKTLEHDDSQITEFFKSEQ